ncbi:MAG: hypothetical protein WCP45_05290 [Verrucomicrobiota bacterium]
MSNQDHYFTFPLAALHGIEITSTPVSILDLCMNCGILSAGIGYQNNNTHEEFKDRLDEVCEKRNIAESVRPGPCTVAAKILVGSALCNVTLGSNSKEHCNKIEQSAAKVAKGGPLVRMSSSSMWAAMGQARWEADPSKDYPDRGISWREFRILCAILSVKVNRQGFCFVGWETIQARACGFTTKDAFKAATVIPDHLAPPLTRKQIRDTADTLEDLGFFARFRMSSGPRGGLMAYSFRHKDHDALGNAVCEAINFRDRANIKANRAKDAEKCLQLLERAKVGPSKDQQ